MQYAPQNFPIFVVLFGKIRHNRYVKNFNKGEKHDDFENLYGWSLLREPEQ